MPMVRVEILEGRDDSVKRELAARITEVMSDVLKLPLEATHLIIEERPRANWATGGVRFSDK